MLQGFRKPLGFLAATHEELRQLRRAIASSMAGGLMMAVLIPLLIEPIIHERLSQVRTQPKFGGMVLRILFYRPTFILEEPLIRRLAKH